MDTDAAVRLRRGAANPRSSCTPARSTTTFLPTVSMLGVSFTTMARNSFAPIIPARPVPRRSRDRHPVAAPVGEPARRVATTAQRPSGRGARATCRSTERATRSTHRVRVAVRSHARRNNAQAARPSTPASTAPAIPASSPGSRSRTRSPSSVRADARGADDHDRRCAPQPARRGVPRRSAGIRTSSPRRPRVTLAAAPPIPGRAELDPRQLPTGACSAEPAE